MRKFFEWMLRNTLKNEFDKIKIIVRESSDFGEFGFEFFDSGSEWAVQEFSSCVDLESTQNSRVNFVGKFESNIGLVLFNGLDDLFLFTFV